MQIKQSIALRFKGRNAKRKNLSKNIKKILNPVSIKKKSTKKPSKIYTVNEKSLHTPNAAAFYQSK